MAQKTGPDTAIDLVVRAAGQQHIHPCSRPHLVVRLLQNPLQAAQLPNWMHLLVVQDLLRQGLREVEHAVVHLALRRPRRLDDRPTEQPTSGGLGSCMGVRRPSSRKWHVLDKLARSKPRVSPQSHRRPNTTRTDKMGTTGTQPHATTGQCVAPRGTHAKHGPTLHIERRAVNEGGPTTNGTHAHLTEKGELAPSAITSHAARDRTDS